MADATVERRDYYVYVLFRETGIPFYVGKGCGDRWMVHERRAKKGETHRDKVVRKVIALCGELPKVKAREHLTCIDAYRVETALIAALGRAPNGPLVNQTDGGDGAPNLSPEASAIKGTRISAAKKGRVAISVEQRARISAALTGRKASPEAIAKKKARKLTEEHRAKLRGKTHTAETREKIGAASRGKRRPPHVVAAIREANTGRSLSAETRAKISATLTGRKVAPEILANWPKRVVSDETRRRLSVAGKGRVPLPHVYEALRKAVTGKARSLVACENMSAGAKRRWAKVAAEKGRSGD